MKRPVMNIEEIEPGDEYWHKATEKKLVVREVRESTVAVTTEDDEVQFYKPEELTDENPNSRTMPRTFS